MHPLITAFLTWKLSKFWKHTLIGVVLTLLTHIPNKVTYEYQYIVSVIIVSCMASLIEIVSPMLKVGNNTAGGALRTLYPSLIALIICILFGANNIYSL